MSVPYSNVGRTVNINKVKGLNFDKFHNDEMCKRTSDATMGRTNIRANETANNNILSLNVGTVKCGNINAELNESSEKRLHINCNNVLTDGLTITQDGNVGIGKTAPTAKLHIDGTVTAGSIYTNTIHAPTSGPDYNLMLKGGNAWAANILIERWNTYYRAEKHYFYRRGNNYDNFPNHPSYGIFFNGSVYWQSDDRLKHNEEDITDALGTIRKLNAQKYQKTDEPKEADFNGELTEYYIEETGFIAQDVMEIPELAYCVTEGVTANGKDIYNLKYNDIFVVNVQATKELDAIVQAQQSKIDSLEARLIALENNN